MKSRDKLTEPVHNSKDAFFCCTPRNIMDWIKTFLSKKGREKKKIYKYIVKQQKQQQQQ